MASFENSPARDGAKSGGSASTQKQQPGQGSEGSIGRSDIAGTASATMRETGDKLKDAAGTAADKLKQTASDVGGELADSAVRLADAQKASGTRILHNVSKAVDAAAGELESDAPFLARPIKDAARGIERFASDFDNRSVGELARRIGDYARREPATVIAGSVLVGFLLTRFLKSSAPRSSSYDEDFESERDWRRRDYESRRDWERADYGRERDWERGSGSREGQFASYGATARPGSVPEASTYSSAAGGTGTETPGRPAQGSSTPGTGAGSFGAQGTGGSRTVTDQAAGSSQPPLGTRTSTFKEAGDV
jgi:hypothetical protein